MGSLWWLVALAVFAIMQDVAPRLLVRLIGLGMFGVLVAVLFALYTVSPVAAFVAALVPGTIIYVLLIGWLMEPTSR